METTPKQKLVIRDDLVSAKKEQRTLIDKLEETKKALEAHGARLRRLDMLMRFDEKTPGFLTKQEHSEGLCSSLISSAKETKKALDHWNYSDIR